MATGSKAVVWNGTNLVRVERVPDPQILNPRDAIVPTMKSFALTAGGYRDCSGGHQEAGVNRNAWIAAALACAASGSAGAQTARTDGDTAMTVTGCVQNIATSSANGAVEKGFLLANATIGDARNGSTSTPTATPPAAAMPTGTSATAAAGMPASPTWPATTGTANSGRPPARANTYMLVGRDGELKNQVGKKVKITGRVDGELETANGSSRTAPVSGMASQAPRLQVTSIKVIASGCSSK